MQKEFTKDFELFVSSIFDITYHEIVDLYYTVKYKEARGIYSIKKANGNTEDLLVEYPAGDLILRMTPNAAAYFPEWLESNHMDGMDVESFFGMKYQIEKED